MDGYSYLPGFKAELGAQPVLRTEGFVGGTRWPLAVKGTQVGTQETAYPLASVPVPAEGPGIPLDGSIDGTRHVRSRSA